MRDAVAHLERNATSRGVTGAAVMMDRMTAPTRRRAVPVLAAALVAASAVAACAPSGDVICSAVGWSNTLEVELEGERQAVDAVALVRVCVGADCVDADGADPPQQEEPEASEDHTTYERVDQIPPETPAARSEIPMTTLTGTNEGGGRWNLGGVDRGSGDTYVVWTYAADGGRLDSSEVVPTWQRIGGSEACGGPHLGTATVDV